MGVSSKLSLFYASWVWVWVLVRAWLRNKSPEQVAASACPRSGHDAPGSCSAFANLASFGTLTFIHQPHLDVVNLGGKGGCPMAYQVWSNF